MHGYVVVNISSDINIEYRNVKKSTIDNEGLVRRIPSVILVEIKSKIIIEDSRERCTPLFCTRL